MSQRPPSWCRATFDDAFTVISDQGKRLPESEYKQEGIFPVIDQGEKQVGGYTDDASLACEGPFPLIVFGDHTRRVKLVERSFVVGAQGIKLLAPSSAFRPKFLFYQFPILELPDRGYSRHFQFVRKLQFITAPVPEQDRIIAEIDKQFTRLDDAVAALKRVQANLKRYRASVLKAACEGRLVPTEAKLARNEGRNYEPASELLKRILAERRAKWEADQLQKMVAAGKPPKNDAWKEKYQEPHRPDISQLPKIPESWCYASVEQLNPSERPCAYGVLQPGPDLEEGIPFVRVGDINDGYIDEAAMKKISPAIAAQYPRTKLEGGEVLITLVGAIGRTAVVPDSLGGANTARAVGVLPLTGMMNPHWVEIWFRNPAKVAEMTLRSHEVARKTLNLEDVRAATVAIPPLPEQKRIVEEVDRRLSIARELMKQVDHQLSKSDSARQSVLHSAFSGKLVPQDPNDEPASVLLERIRAERASAQAQHGKASKATNGTSSVNGQRRRRGTKLAQRVSAGKG